MSRLASAAASVSEAISNLDSIGDRIKALREADGTPDELASKLEEIENELFLRARSPVSAAEDELMMLQAEDVAADVQADHAAMRALLTSSRLVTQQDIDAVDATLKGSIEEFAARVDVPEVKVVDSQELTTRIDAFKTEIAQQGALGDRISKVVSTVVGIGRTAVKVLA